MAARKLKVFQAQMGFYDTVVAASSQAAALRAWGTRQNLFASGDAALTTEASAVAAAQQDYVRRRQAAKEDLEAAKTAYRREGGRD